MNRVHPTYVPDDKSPPPTAPPTFRDDAVTWISLVFLISLMIYLCVRQT